jgi:hypothetical protein
MKSIKESFWEWYERNYALNVGIAAFLFGLQLFHLYWLFTDVVLVKLTGQSYFGLQSIWGQISIFFDYTEIPAIIATTLVYVHQLKTRFNYKSLMYLIFINTQWLHILWITDEYVVERFSGSEAIVWGSFLAWVAILIDFLELPVIYDTIKETIKEWAKRKTA